MKLFRILFIAVIICVVQFSPVSAWRSQLFPINWVPVDEEIVEGVNVFRDSAWAVDEKGNSVSAGHPAYHPQKYLHDFSYAGYAMGEKDLPSLDLNSWTSSARIYDVTKSPYNCIPNGTADCTPAIQKAIDNAGADGGGIVYLPQGEYRIRSSRSYFLRINGDKVVLRGDGQGRTKIKVDPYSNGKFNMSYKSVILIDGGKNWQEAASSSFDITKDLILPTKKIPISDVSSFKVGDPIIIKTNGRTSSFLKEHDMEDYWRTGEPGYIFRRKIVSIDTVNKVLEVDVPTRYRIKRTDLPIVVKAFPSVSDTGIEHLSFGQIRHPAEWTWSGDIITARDTGSIPIISEMWQTRLIKINNAENSWIFDVGSYMPSENAGRYSPNTDQGRYEIEVLNEAILLSYSRFISVKDVYFKNAQVDAGSANGYAVRVEGSELLLENVTIRRFKKGFAIENQWSSGNVIKDSFTNQALDTSDLFHWELSMANLIENHVSNGSYWKAIIMSNDQQGHSSSESVFWNTNGLRYPDVALDSKYDRDNDNNGILDFSEPHGEIEDVALVISNQYGHGYVIGTSGAFSNVLTPRMQRSINGNFFRPYTLPLDHLEGEGIGDLLEPRSLYDSQLALRLGINSSGCVDNDGDGCGANCPLGNENCAAEGGTIVDDGDSGYSELGDWKDSGGNNPYLGDSRYSQSLGAEASWTAPLEPGAYKVYTRWTWWKSRPPNAPYLIFSGNNQVGNEIRVNQFDSNLANAWQLLGEFTFDQTPKVVLRSEGNYSFNADAVSFVKAGNLTQGCMPETTGEVCDGRDNDCDGQIDELITTPYYSDDDGDGYSDGNALVQCTRPSGYKTAGELIAISGDCDDGNAGIHPGALEICDGVDNNCVNGVDENNGNCGGSTPHCNGISCVRCTQGIHCQDGLYCNGAEVCQSDNCITGTQQCTDGGQTCNEGTDSCNVCTLTNAFWTTTNVVQGQPVTLTVQGSNCAGQTVNFVVWEADATNADDSAAVNPISATFIGSGVGSSWTAEWQCDGNVGGVCTEGNPEYFFMATVPSNGASISSETLNNGLLSTTAQSLKCRNGITEGTEQCDDGNTDNNDTCTNACQNAICGDNIIRTGVEICDGNSEPCSNGGYAGTKNCLSPASCTFSTTCALYEYCGDGATQSAAGETCDDDDLINGDGCSSTCQTETVSFPGVTINLANNSVVNSSNVTIDFIATNWVVGGRTTNHIHFHMEGVPGYVFTDHFMFYNGSDSIAEFNINPGATAYATWIDSDTVRFNNVPDGQHRLRVHLADPFHNAVSGADLTIVFTVNTTLNGIAEFCGDGICNAGEVCDVCDDCGACPAPSGGGGGGGGRGGTINTPRKPTANESRGTPISSKQTVVLSEEISLIDVSNKQQLLLQIESKIYEVSFELSDYGVVLNLANGDYFVPKGDVLPVLLGNKEVFIGVDEFGASGAGLVLGLNENAVNEKLGAISVLTNVKKKNDFFYYVLLTAAVAAIIIISILLLVKLIRSKKKV